VSDLQERRGRDGGNISTERQGRHVGVLDTFNGEEGGPMFLSRRQFLKVSAGTVAAVAVADHVLALTALQPVIEVGNPLGDYPDRSWERVYHDQ
jgi:hypothetical protein